MSSHIFHLREIAHSRAGDKGDTSNVSVIAYRPEFFPVIVEQVTINVVRAYFGALVKGQITRYTLPHHNALNIVMEESLGGGVTRSLSLDPHGKSYSALMLTLPVLINVSLSEVLFAAGRKPVDRNVLLRLRELGRLPAHIEEIFN